MADESYVAMVPASLEELIPRYLQRRRDDIEHIRETVRAGEFGPAEVAGHSMKGSGGGYGFDAISELGTEIESAAAEGRSDDVLAATDRLEHYVELVEVVIVDDDE